MDVRYLLLWCPCYADDLLLLSASRSGLQAMVSICERFAKVRKLKFSTNVDPVKSKTKCVVFSKVKKARENVAPIILNGDPLPWVDRVKHLGNMLESDNSMRADCLAKRGAFIGKVNSLLQEFCTVDHSVMVKLLRTYVTSFYGSNLWDVYSPEVTRIFSSWNVTIRNVFNLPWTTHRYFIEAVSGTSHPKAMLCSRLVKFWEGLRTCKKGSVRYLVSLVHDDRRTMTGRTVSKIADDCFIERKLLTSAHAKKICYFPPPVEERWRIHIVKELIEVRDGKAEVPGFSQAEVKEMLYAIASN